MSAESKRKNPSISRHTMLFSLIFIRVKKCLNAPCKAWLSKKTHSWHTTTITPIQAISYLQLAGVLQGFLRVLFTVCICFRQVTTSEVKPHLQQGILPSCHGHSPLEPCSASLPVTTTAKPLLAATHLRQLQSLHVAPAARRRIICRSMN